MLVTCSVSVVVLLVSWRARGVSASGTKQAIIDNLASDGGGQHLAFQVLEFFINYS